jgi:glycosyltransferase involved in cell wall biosynthesis
MTGVGRKDTAIIIPARNEADRIGACLTSLAAGDMARAVVVLVVNNTTDATADVARDVGSGLGLHLKVLERILVHGVGQARRIGCAVALDLLPDLQTLATTDADCLLAPDWLARNLDHLARVDAVCGKIGIIPAEAGITERMDQTLACHEGTYRQLVLQVFARFGAHSGDIADTHAEAAGASLACRKAAYLAVDGFAAIPCGEDRRIVRAWRMSGHRVMHADDVKAHASARLDGRAAGGMSDALRARTSGADYLVDDTLPDAGWLTAQASAGTLGAWPPRMQTRLRVRDLPAHIKMLRDFLVHDPQAQAAGIC